MEFWNRVRQLEHSIAATVDGMVRRGSPATPCEPLAVMLAIVDVVERQMQHAGRGRRVFPFNRIRVTVAAGGHDERARFEAVFGEEPTLDQRIAERLTACGCDASRLSTRVAFVPAAAASWLDPQFHVEFARAAPLKEEVPAPAPAPPAVGNNRITLAVTGGAAERDSYTFTGDRINIGRCAEVRDQRQRLLRVNHVAFPDEEAAANGGVSRRHAHIVRLDAGRYHVIDDHSTRGTCVLRAGRTIDVPAGGRGLRLQSGDELVLAGARLSVEIADA